MKYYVAVDLGATSGRVVLASLDKVSAVLAVRSRTYASPKSSCKGQAFNFAAFWPAGWRIFISLQAYVERNRTDC